MSSATGRDESLESKAGTSFRIPHVTAVADSPSNRRAPVGATPG